MTPKMIDLISKMAKEVATESGFTPQQIILTEGIAFRAAGIVITEMGEDSKTEWLLERGVAMSKGEI